MTEPTSSAAGAEQDAAARAAAVTAALRVGGELGPGEEVTSVEQLSGGWSRHTYVATAALRAGGERRYVIRAEAPGGVLDTDLASEYALYGALATAEDIATPRAFHFDGAADNPFGVRYVVMEHVPGRAANTFRAPDREWLEADWTASRTIATAMVDNLARLHAFPADRIPAGAVQELGFLDVVDRWQGIYEDRHLVRDPVSEEAFAWLRSRVPADEQRGVVHGDFRVGNVLVADGRLTAILDWELAYVGDVRFDLGYLALERLAGKHLQPVTPLLNAFAEEDWFFEQYAQRTGRPVDREVVRTFSVLGVMMLLATHYMGVWMYAHGESRDFRLAWNRFGAVGLRQDLTHLMEW